MQQTRYEENSSPESHPGAERQITGDNALWLVGILLIALVLRLAYAWHSHPFFDEYVTILAARMILQSGLPVLPSGLFY